MYPRIPARVAIVLAAALLPLPAAPTPTLEAGLSHNLAITASKRVVAWGENTYGALGNGTQAHASTPVRSGTLESVVAVAAGRDLSVALRSDGTVWTWGGGMGVGLTAPETCFTRPCSLVPRQVHGLTGVRAIAASGGGDFVLALRADGSVVAWGRNAYGTLGNGTETDRLTPAAVALAKPAVAIAAGDRHGVALLDDGTVWTWGTNAMGELGTALTATAANTCAIGGGTPCAKMPVRAGAGRVITADTFGGVAAISAKGRHTLALKADGTVWAWGSDYYGQLGDGKVVDRADPEAVPGMAGVAAVAAGFSHSIAVKRDGSYWAWGLDLSGQLGAAPATETCEARPLPGGSLIPPYMLGKTWACRKKPTFVKARDGAVAIVGGGAHSLTVRPDGAIVAFGLNSFGQRGDGDIRSTLVGVFCYSDPGSCPGLPQGATATGISIGRAATAGSLNAETLDDGLVFAEQAVGTTSSAQELRITSVGDSFRVTAITTTGDFRHTSNCGTTLLVRDASCGIFITFSPAGAGTRNGTVTVATDLEVGSTASLNLRGTGLATSHALSVSRSGTGSGRVTSSPAGIDCGTTCSAQFAAGLSVTLTATPASGSTFGGWSGACTGTGSCVVAMTASRSVAASFTAGTTTNYTLTVARIGTGAGTVSSSPAGIDCGAACSAQYASGTSVTLAATPAAGSAFGGWSGACTGTGSCSVAMTSARSVTASFTASPASHLLTVTRSGNGTGTVASSPAGILCGTTCAATFNGGTLVALSASPAAGSIFGGWGGACGGTGACSVTMNAPASVSATFSIAPTGGDNYTALWWNPGESGWGLNISHQGDILFGTLFTYDATGRPLWLVMPAGERQGTSTTYNGTLYRTTGPPFNAVPFTPIGPQNLTVVGAMTFTYTGSGAALAYSYDGVTVSKLVQKQVFGSRAATCVPTTGSRAALVNYQDLWWNADESGWGVNITHQGDTLFATLFTYDATGRGLWLVLPAGTRQADGSYFGRLLRTRGPPFNAAPFTPIGEADLTEVGTMRFTFSSGTAGVMTYTVSGITVTKAITRQVFSTPVPACAG
ncbi:MAG: hypothetical protein KF738_08050 [Burkholderiales bacterium]|nr:hypothetical protein [Burkholderiales bacterium]